MRNAAIASNKVGVLAFHEFRGALESGSQASLRPLHGALNRDFSVLSYVIEHGASVEFDPIEHRLLSWDYRIMDFWYHVTSAPAPAMARQALDEMAAIVEFLARRLGEQTGTRVEA